MHRRAFIALFGGATLAWPLAANAQQPDRIRRIGLLQGLAAGDQDWQRRLSAFRQGLAQLGWVEGRNIILDIRYADGNPERLPPLAADLVAAQVEVIVTNAAQPIDATRKVTSSIPIVMPPPSGPIEDANRNPSCASGSRKNSQTMRATA